MTRLPQALIEHLTDHAPYLFRAQYFKLAQTALLGGYVAHLLACGFYFVGAGAYYVGDDNNTTDGIERVYGQSWLSNGRSDGGPGYDWVPAEKDMNWNQLGAPYISSIYWAFTTISTVGRACGDGGTAM